MKQVSVEQFAQAMNLKCFTPDVPMGNRYITKSDVNRPGLELTGFMDHFAKERIQVIGKVERAYLQELPEKTRKSRY